MRLCQENAATTRRQLLILKLLADEQALPENPNGDPELQRQCKQSVDFLGSFLKSCEEQMPKAVPQ